MTSGRTIVLSFNSANTPGNLIVAYVVWGNNGAVTLGDSRGNQYASAVGPHTFAANQYRAQVFYAKNVAGGTNTVTATFATTIGNFGLLYLHEYAGVDRVDPFDVTAGATGTTVLADSGTATTRAGNELLVGVGMTAHAYTGPGTGYTSRIITTPDADIAEDRVVASAGTYRATAPQNCAGAWIMQLVSFKGTT